MDQSILTSIKKLLLMTEDYEAYDFDIIMHINSVFSLLFQLGVGPQFRQFRINDKTAVWSDFLEDDELLDLVKSYMYLKIKLLFDPPDAGFVLSNFQEQIREYEWRLNVAYDPMSQGAIMAMKTELLKILYENAVQEGFTGTYDEWLALFNGYINLEPRVKAIEDGTSDIYHTITAERIEEIFNLIYGGPGGSGGSGGGGLSPTLQADLTASIAAGGIKIGDKFIQGEQLEMLWRSLLDPVKNPTFTAPSASITPFGGYLLETGSVVGKTVRVDFNRGSISPSLGTSGFRAGEAISYTLDGVTQPGDIFNITADESHAEWTAVVEHGEGEQPKNSKGEDYDSPYPGGTITSSVLRFEFVDAIWSNQNDILNVTKEDLVSKSAKSKIFNFPAQTKTNVETFDIPASWTVTKIEVYNDISRQFEDDAEEFTVTRVTHPNAAGEEVEYRRYSDNRGYAAGERQIKVTWA